jgi:1-acyl-sn-glycerol-3-phosphate acyltransferase
MRVSTPPLPQAMPRQGNRFSRWLGRRILGVLGWRIRGDLPDEPQLIVAVGPHTSNWDFIIGIGVILALGVRVNYLMKREAFFWPFAGLFRCLGGIPLDRRNTADTVPQIVAHYRQNPALWLAITPEGTRAKVPYWKTGFLRIAADAGVPVLIAAWDYSHRTFVLDRVWSVTDDHAADAEAIRRHVCGSYQGRHPALQ